MLSLFAEKCSRAKGAKRGNRENRQGSPGFKTSSRGSECEPPEDKIPAAREQEIKNQQAARQLACPLQLAQVSAMQEPWQTEWKQVAPVIAPATSFRGWFVKVLESYLLDGERICLLHVTSSTCGESLGC
jgi:hypothetical protein